MTSGFAPALLLRISREYEEQPGLRVTPAQVQRLWGLDGPTCRTALTAWVDAGVLQRNPDGQFTHRSSLRDAWGDSRR
jgi:hypothetical protein